MAAVQSSKNMAVPDPSTLDSTQGIQSELENNSLVVPGTDKSHHLSGPSISEHGSVASRCSVRLIHEIISEFSPQKVQLVRSIGFDGILHLPHLKQINIRFSTWLMTRVDELLQTLAIADGSRIQFNKHDVSLVFGIPAGGTSIFTKPVNLHGRVPVGSSSGSVFDPKDLRSIKATQSIVSRVHESSMNEREQNEFRAAFVVFVMSTLLAPSAKHDRVSGDFMHAIQNPAEIRQYDWSDYVLRRLLDAVAKLKADIANSAKAPYIYGCSLFLQVLYLDSVDLGLLSMEHDVFPRIRSFTSDRIRSMIAADVSFAVSGGNTFEPRRIKLRRPDGICYHWARIQAPKNASPLQNGRMLALWVMSVMMTRVLKIPAEAAGPLFIAASDFQRQMKCDACPDPLKVIDVFLHIIEPYINGFSYKPSIRLNSRPIDLCNLGHKPACQGVDCCFHFSAVRVKRKRGECSGECSSNGPISGVVNQDVIFSNVDEPTITSTVSTDTAGSADSAITPRNSPPPALSVVNLFDDVDIRAINAMARFYLTLNPVKATRCADLNLSPRGDELYIDVYRAGGSNMQHLPRSPWELGFRCNIDLGNAAAILRKLCYVEDTDEPWIVHFCPKYIEVLTRAIKQQCRGHAEFEMEFFDAVIRRFKQIDDQIYVHEGPSRWRHYVESDFMISLMAGCFDITDPVVRAHFCGRHINYDVSACRIIFFPLLLHHRWVCFAWRMVDNTIVVYDPCSPRNTLSALTHSYERVVKLLKSAMVSVSSLCLEGWSHDWEDARLEIFNHCSSYSNTDSANRSGLLCLHFCRCYNGVSICPPIDEEHYQEWSASILGEVSSLDGNWGVVPNIMR